MMAFDLSTAKPAGKSGGFDLSTAQPYQPEAPIEKMTQQEFETQYGDIPDIYGQIQEPEPQPEPTLGEQAIGAGEAALTAVTGATGGTLGMIGGTLQGLAEEIRSGEFGSREAADRIEQRAMELMGALTYQPRTETGKEYIQAIGEAGEQLTPLAGLAGPVQQVSQMGRAATPQITKAARATGQAVQPAKDIAAGIFDYQTPTKQRIARLLEAGEADIETAPYKLVGEKRTTPDIIALEGPSTATQKLRNALNIGGPRVQKDKVAQNTIKQGFDEGVIAAVKASNKEDKEKMQRMVNIMEKSKANRAYAMRNRPSDVAGESLMDRVKFIRNENKKAGQDLDKAAQNLKKSNVDSDPAISQFISDLDNMGIALKQNDKGKIFPDFTGSDIEGLAAPEAAITRMVSRLGSKQANNAYELHRLKKYIDENVTYGKGGEGLAGKTERVLKDLRRNIDSILDNNFPEYDKANTKYADTIQALDSIQDVAGRKMDLSLSSADKATGTLLRRIMSNAQSRVRLLDSIDDIENVANQYGGKFSDDLMTQTLFVDELDRMFGTPARTSFQGQVQQAVEQATGAMTSPSERGNILMRGIGKAAEKVRGINEENAIKSIKDLLSE